MKFKTAYDIIANILGLEKVPDERKIYKDRKTKRRYVRTKWGFEAEEKYNLKIKVLRLEKKLEKINRIIEELSYDNDMLLRKREGIAKQLRICQDHSKKMKREKGFINKLLKEVLDRNVALEKKYLRLINQEENLRCQAESLKRSKNNLLEQYNDLIEKNRDQKKQLQDLQNVIINLKQKTKAVE